MNYKFSILKNLLQKYKFITKFITFVLNKSAIPQQI